MKIPVTMKPACGSRKRAVTLSLRPALLFALGLPMCAPLAAVVMERAVILCPSGDAEVWEFLLSDFPASFVGVADALAKK